LLYFHSVQPYSIFVVSWRKECQSVRRNKQALFSQLNPVLVETIYRAIRFLAREHGPWIWFSDPATVNQTCCILNYFCTLFLPIDIGIAPDFPLTAVVSSSRLQVPQFYTGLLYGIQLQVIPCGLRRRSVAARLLGSRVRIPDVGLLCCEVCG
jgi:hypothetical protein